MIWESFAVGLVLVAIAVFLFVRGPHLAADEASMLDGEDDTEPVRRRNYRVAAVVVGGMGVLLTARGVWG